MLRSTSRRSSVNDSGRIRAESTRHVLSGEHSWATPGPAPNPLAIDGASNVLPSALGKVLGGVSSMGRLRRHRLALASGRPCLAPARCNHFSTATSPRSWDSIPLNISDDEARGLAMAPRPPKAATLCGRWRYSKSHRSVGSECGSTQDRTYSKSRSTTTGPRFPVPRRRTRRVVVPQRRK